MFQTLAIEWMREYLITVAVTYIFPALSGFIPAKRYQFLFQRSGISFIPAKQYQFSFQESNISFHSWEAVSGFIRGKLPKKNINCRT